MKELNELFYLNDNNQKMIRNENIHKLQYLSFNRPAGSRKILVNSINKHGVITVLNLIKTDLISGEEEYYIADGQNRAKSIMNTNKDAPVFICETVFTTIAEIVNYVSLLNSLQVPWKADDYIKAYAELNLPDYKFLDSFKGATSWSLNTLAILFTSSNTKSLHSLKNGTYKANTKKEGLEVIEFANKLGKHHIMSSRMLLSLNRTMKLKAFNEENFEKNYILNIQDVIKMDLDKYDDIFEQWI